MSVAVSHGFPDDLEILSVNREGERLALERFAHKGE